MESNERCRCLRPPRFSHANSAFDFRWCPTSDTSPVQNQQRSSISNSILVRPEWLRPPQQESLTSSLLPLSLVHHAAAAIPLSRSFFRRCPCVWWLLLLRTAPNMDAVQRQPLASLRLAHEPPADTTYTQRLGLILVPTTRPSRICNPAPLKPRAGSHWFCFLFEDRRPGNPTLSQFPKSPMGQRRFRWNS